MVKPTNSFTKHRNINTNGQYLVAIISMFFFGVVGIVLVSTLRQGQDLPIIITAIFSVLTPTTLSLLSFMKSQETHLSVNSRLDDFIKNVDIAARAEGQIEGARVANKRNDERATYNEKIKNK